MSVTMQTHSNILTVSLEEGNDAIISASDAIRCVHSIRVNHTVLHKKRKKKKATSRMSKSKSSVSVNLDSDSDSGCDKGEKNVHGEQSLPQAIFREIRDYVVEEVNFMQGPSAPYIKWNPNENKKTLGVYARVDYEIDEVDKAWLDLFNLKRKHPKPISVNVFERVMDRFEKESFLQNQSTGVDPRDSFDESDVCCICLDGECPDTNMMIYCDVCNIAVHQECYGVPYIPQGQWICRRCLVSPSQELDCAFCPNKRGAFKRTEDGRWSHVSCALWIPELCFSNTTFLEPVEGIQYIPPARYRLTCFICKCKAIGACIQCNKARCYVAFHVTCAQLAGIYMKMEAVFKGEDEIINKIAYCNNHAPLDHANRDMDSSIRQKLKECRQRLTERRNAKQTVSVPYVKPNALVEISAPLRFAKKGEFIKRALAYWKLKRIQRNGVPLC